jgi:hypothetical protein
MSSIPRTNPATLFGLPPLGAFMRSAFPKASPRRENAATPAPAKLAGTWPTAPVADEIGIDMGRVLAAAKVSPDLALIEWDGDRTRGAAPAVEAPAAAVNAPAAVSAAHDAPLGDDFDPAALDPRRRKIRERYIGARFPGVARTLAELQSSDRIIKSARLYFEDEQPELALELLEVASQESPHESPLWLARLEILYLARDADGFVAAARAFRRAHPRHEAWPEIERLGRALVPGEALFGATAGPRDHEHYGPWPHTPNWIQAPWDLTAEIAAADFHRTAMRLAGRAANA